VGLSAVDFDISVGHQNLVNVVHCSENVLFLLVC